ncbi:pterocarpan synthase 1-like [Musa acuminata AAA Group]|uniref:pterocarpan synthase 1-like n=1 Tax=Musa acuminata AAA Group TaxID=214697 RepID=UPI0031D2F800
MASSPSFTLLLLFLFATVAIGSSSREHKEKMTHLHFYFYDYYGGSNATTVTVVSPPGNNTFGSIGVGENILRVGRESSSKLIGKAQELTVQASLESPAYLSALNFVFTAGKYNGSSFSILGRAVLTEPRMERGIVGGTGKFRMARGYTISRLIRSTGTTQMELVFEYDAYIYHY